MRIQSFDPATASDTEWAAYHSLILRTRAAVHPDGYPPPLAWFRNSSTNRGDLRHSLYWHAYDGDEIVGGVEADWWDGPDNRDRLWFNADVSDEQTLDALVAAAAPAIRETGRTLFMFDVPVGSPFSPVLAARGGRMGSVEQHNVLPLDALSRDDIVKIVDDVPDGYELVWFAGPTPDDLLEPYAAVLNTMNTAPRDDLTMEDWQYYPERVRDWEKGIARRGAEAWNAIARHVATGELAAFTQLIADPTWPEVIEQDDTAVAVPHRGHGLGLWVKAVNILHALDSGGRRITTWNAASNEHMLRVNRALGFVCEHTWENWEITLDQLEAQPS